MLIASSQTQPCPWRACRKAAVLRKAGAFVGFATSLPRISILLLCHTLGLTTLTGWTCPRRCPGIGRMAVSVLRLPFAVATSFSVDCSPIWLRTFRGAAFCCDVRIFFGDVKGSTCVGYLAFRLTFRQTQLHLRGLGVLKLLP